jgi:hypothetical protein
MSLRNALAFALFAPLSVATAQEPNADLNNSIRVEYQFIHTGLYDTNFGPLDIGETDSHILLFSGVHRFNERWMIYGSIPYVQKRHEGAFPHDYTEFVNYDPPGRRVIIDDGHYQGGFQDLFAGVQYRAVDGPFSVLPYISFGVPVTDYPFYGSAAIGKHLWQLPVGVTMEFTPYFSDWYFQADVAYIFSEQVLGVNLDSWLLSASAGYYVTPRFASHVFLASRHVPGGLAFPEDFTDDESPDDFDNENYYRHDQTLKHAYTNAGIGFDYIASDRYEISATYYKTIATDNVAEVDHAFTLALTRHF